MITNIATQCLTHKQTQLAHKKPSTITALIDSCIAKPVPAKHSLGHALIENQGQRTILSSLQDWLDIFKKITRSTGAVACIKESKQRSTSGQVDYVYDYELSLLGAQLIDALDKSWPYANAVTLHPEPELHYAPSLRLLFESAQKRELRELISAPPDSRAAMVRCCDVINGFVNDIREQAASARFREKQKEFTRGPNDNLRWLRSIADECFLGNERVLVTCLDLHYINTIPAPPVETYKQVKADGKALRDYLGKQFFGPEGILGYGLNLRYLPQRGYHYRLLVISRVDAKVMVQHLPGAIEDTWKHITGTNGAVLNLFQSLNMWLKIISRNDGAMRKVLDEQLYYLTQLDSLVRLRLAPKDRHFFRGEK